MPLGALVWHSGYTAFYLHPHYLLFVCYTANLLLAIGMIIRSGVLVGTGFGWTLIGLPLWVYYAVLNSDWEPSGIVFHVCWVLVGGLAIKDYRLPGYTFCSGLGLGVLLYVLSRIFTEESLNVNAAFRVYDGWEGLFPDYRLYLIIMLIGFGGFFIFFTWANNRFIISRNVSDD